MKVTVTTLGEDIYSLDVNEDMELENFKALLEFESGVPSGQFQVIFNGNPLVDAKKKLGEYGVADGDVMLLQRNATQSRAPGSGARSTGGLPMIDFGSINIPGMSSGGSNGGNGREAASAGAGIQMRGGLPEDPATLRQMLLASPHDLSILKERNPPLAEALLSGDLEKFSKVLKQQQDERAKREQQRIRMLNADPFDASVQQQIAEEIRLKNVESNMETAMEFAPESFGQVVMLYIDCTVNGHPVKAFVDSGAQMTIMSKQCAERCNIMRLVDSRWAGIAKGVGVQKIIGRVHLCQIQIGPDFLQSSFSILEEQPMDMLLGLDMLKRHQCSIDLKRNLLVIGTTGTETPFLAEGDIPEHARLNRQASETGMDEDQQLAEALAKSAQDSTNQASKPSTSSGAGAASDVPPGYSEEAIKKLMEYGFSRQQVLDELKTANGNMDQALASLFAKSFQVPS